MARRRIIINICVCAVISLRVLCLSPTGGQPPRYSPSYRMSAEEPKRISIVFAGDLMQHMPQVEAARIDSSGFSYGYCFRHIAPLFMESDLVVVNLETTLSETPPYSGYPLFRSPAHLAVGMRDAGIDVALLANNHICDMGGTGILKTMYALDSVGIRHTGAFADSVRHRLGNPLTIYRNGFKIHILNYTYGTNGIKVPEGRIVNLIDTAAMSRDLALIEPSAESLVFVCLHWGVEYDNVPTARQDSLAAWLRPKGVNFIIGSHPHVVQPVRIHHGPEGEVAGLTAYSLGNFVSNQTYPGTDGGMILRLEITKHGPYVAIVPEIAYVWSYKSFRGGRRRYEIIPSYDAQGLLAPDSSALKGFESFYRDARRVATNGSAVSELKEFSVKGKPVGPVPPAE